MKFYWQVFKVLVLQSLFIKRFFHSEAFKGKALKIKYFLPDFLNKSSIPTKGWFLKWPLIFSILLFGLVGISCSNRPTTDSKSPPKLDHSSSSSVIEAQNPSLKREDLGDPKLYFYKTGKVLDVPSVNRENLTLSLWDQIVFWKSQPLETPDHLAGFPTPVEELKEGALKLKVSSFCSYVKEDEVSKRQEKESVYDQYPLFVRLIDLIPEKILLEGGRDVFYCSFIVGLKNESLSNEEEVVFDWFNISQQMISPHVDFSNESVQGVLPDSVLQANGQGESKGESNQLQGQLQGVGFNPLKERGEAQEASLQQGLRSSSEESRELSLVRETESGVWLSVENQLIEVSEKARIHLINETQALADTFHLMCNGRQLGVISSTANNKIPVFMNMEILLPVDGLEEEGDLSCRFWAKRGQSITAMTDFFHLDKDFFKSYEMIEPKVPDLQKIQSVSVLDHNVSIDQYRNALNAYFMFEVLEQNTPLDYSSVDIVIKNMCTSQLRNTFGEPRTRVITKQFPFRKKIPLMAVMPLEAFLLHRMGPGTIRARRRAFLRGFNGELKSSGKPYRMHFGSGSFFSEDSKYYPKQKDKRSLNCHYSITLKDRHNPENKRVFEPAGYKVFWTNASYGIDYIPMAGHSEVTPVVPQAALRGGQERHYFLSMRHDIDKGHAGSFMHDFDIIDDPFLKTEGVNIDRASLVCHADRDRNRVPSFVAVDWPYASLPQPLLLKTVFSDPKIKSFINNKVLTLCRFMLYEGDLLRYFSAELKVTK